MNQEARSKGFRQQGFTLMEVVVATTIFVVAVSSLMALFDYTLKINRRSEALRQASQGMRNFVEFLVKEVRNGQIDYYVDSYGKNAPYINGNANVPCQHGIPGGAFGGIKTYDFKDNKLGIINSDFQQECFYFGTEDGSYTDVVSLPTNPSHFAAPIDPLTGSTKPYTLVMEKAGVSGKQILTPPNFKVDYLMFQIRPVCDPYSKCQDYQTGGVNDYARIQPFVTILIKFTVKLPTGEQISIPYQTSVSTNKYDILH